ncbi:MAG: SMC-Scp complex subunit ScpB, partial [Rhodothermales bacterium]|nr:SMC-Scp complex subunit ScpB [Rhodothermales bacterium]
VDRINILYERTDRSFRIHRWAGGYRFATVEDMGPYVRSLFASDRERRLTRTLMETIAILAYRQPTTRAEIEFVRGVDCDYSLRKLMEYGLVDVTGRADTIGRPLLYGTTDRFLELFGLNSLQDLPNLREVESILDDPAFQKEKAKMLMTSGLKLPQGVDASDVDDLLEDAIEDAEGDSYRHETNDETE